VRWVGREPRSDDGAAADDGETAEEKAGIRDVQRRFLAVFWLFKMADWLQGPYFYDVYVRARVPLSLDLCNLCWSGICLYVCVIVRVRVVWRVVRRAASPPTAPSPPADEDSRTLFIRRSRDLAGGRPDDTCFIIAARTEPQAPYPPAPPLSPGCPPFLSRLSRTLRGALPSLRWSHAARAARTNDLSLLPTLLRRHTSPPPPPRSRGDDAHVCAPARASRCERTPPTRAATATRPR
jgi:hypothetical protein